MTAASAGPKPAQGGDRGCKGQLREVAVLAQEMIGDQELRQRQRRAVPHLAAVLVGAELIVAHRTQVGQVLPNGILQLGGMLRGHVAVDLQKVRRASLVARQSQADARSGRIVRRSPTR